MKGITPIIAIILLLMITIAMVGFAFIWFTTVTQTTTGNMTQQLSQQQRQLQTKIRIENIDNAQTGDDTVTFRNTGTVAIDMSEVNLYVDGNLQDISSCTGTIQPGGTLSCSIADLLNGCDSPTGDGKIRVTTIGQGNEVNCP